jgi:exoribonuclease R
MEIVAKNIKIIISDRNYTSWHFLDAEDKNKELDTDQYPLLKTVDPIGLKLFNRDIINVDIDGTVTVKYSFVKTSTTMAGVLVLEGNKTFGRSSNKKRLLYKCIPDDRRQPVFIVPYELKIGFSKVYKNKFVTFKYDSWNDKHPLGIITETIGDVDNLEVFYEYQLYCKSIHESILDFTNKTRSVLNKKTHDEYIEQIFNNKDFAIEDRRYKYTFTIDPPNSIDFDDGFSIEKTTDGKNIVTIYIANVFFWIETLGLWNSFSRRVSTIYLPDRRRPMLPTILSDTLCSLQKGQLRFALAMDILFDEYGGLIEHDDAIKYKNVLINVSKNYI